MSVLTAAQPETSALSGARLRRWMLVLVAVAAAALAWLLDAFTPVSGWAGTVLVGALLYLIGQSALSFRVEGRRHAVDRLVSTAVYTAFALAMLPLGAVLFEVVRRGGGLVNLDFLTHSLRNIGPTDTGGGVYHGIVGTLEQAALSSLISIPVAILTAIYLVEYGRGWFARLVTFFVDVMTGIPSIVAGLFVFTVWVLMLGLNRSGFAATLALTILMIPIVVRSTEEMLKLVPDSLREAAYALGVPKWRTILKVVVPTALPGTVTGIMLGVARVMGETAPLLLLNGFTSSINLNPFSGPQAALPLIVWDQAGRPNPEAIARAWGTALVLIVLVLLLNLGARALARLSRTR